MHIKDNLINFLYDKKYFINIYDNYKNTTYLADYIKEKNNNNNIFQGNVTSNYVLFNNLTWRIIKINNDSTITMILDDYINVLIKN